MAEHALMTWSAGCAPVSPLSHTAKATDRELLENFLQQHDEGAFCGSGPTTSAVRVCCLNRVLSDPDDLDDAFQATFLVLVRKASSVRWQEGLGTWLLHGGPPGRGPCPPRGSDSAAPRGRGAGRVETTTAPPDLSCREACDLVHEELNRLPDSLRLPLLRATWKASRRDEAAVQLGGVGRHDQGTAGTRPEPICASAF